MNKETEYCTLIPYRQEAQRERFKRCKLRVMKRREKQVDVVWRRDCEATA
jgi:hypothetical protein